MYKHISRQPWKYLDTYRGKAFTGEWPTFPEMFKIETERFADRPCFTDFSGPNGDKKTLTYKEVYSNVIKLAQWLIANGLKKGDRVAISGKNSPEWCTAFMATHFASGVVIPIADVLHTAEVTNLFKVAEPKFAFFDDGKIPYLKENHPNVITKSLNPTEPENYIYNLSTTNPETWNEPVVESDLALINFTSGTTGNPKGVMLSHKNIICDGYLTMTNIDFYPEDIFYQILPVHHCYGMLAAFIMPLEIGASVVFGKTLAISRVLKDLHDGEVSVMFGVPLIYNKLLAKINKDIQNKGAFKAATIHFLRGVSYGIKKLTGKNIGKALFKSILQESSIYTWRVAMSGAGPLAPSVFKQCNEMGINFIQGYGLTETSPIITITPIEHFKIESVGRDYSPYNDIKTIPSEFSSGFSKKGHYPIGEIVIKGPMVMMGYYNMPEETAKVFTEDGYFRTGDLGWIDDEHFVFLCGRAKNMIVTSGGKNVYPEELENAFQLYNDVQQVVIRGYYNEGDKLGNKEAEEIEALIYVNDSLYKTLNLKRDAETLQPEVRAEVEKIVSKVNKTLCHFQQITRVTVLKEPLALTPSSKVKRNFVANTY